MKGLSSRSTVAYMPGPNQGTLGLPGSRLDLGIRLHADGEHAQPVAFQGASSTWDS